MREISIKPVFNKKNKQINFSIPKSKFSKAVNEKFDKLKRIKLSESDLEFF